MARTLEWSIPSPAPIYNFAVLPKAEVADAWWEEKQGTVKKQPVPSNV